MVRWTTVDVPPKPPITVRASVIDPEHGLIEEVAIGANRLALVSLLGGDIRSYLRVPGNDYVLSPVSRPEASWCWRKNDMTFASGCVVVGHDSETDYLAEVATSIQNLRNSIAFRGPAEVVGPATRTVRQGARSRNRFGHGRGCRVCGFATFGWLAFSLFRPRRVILRFAAFQFDLAHISSRSPGLGQFQLARGPR
jgi:hypothetical protein